MNWWLNFTGALLLLCCRAVVKQIVKLNEQIKNRGILEKSEISGKSCSNSEMHQKVSFSQYILRAKWLFQYYILNFRAKSTHQRPFLLVLTWKLKWDILLEFQTPWIHAAWKKLMTCRNKVFLQVSKNSSRAARRSRGGSFFIFLKGIKTVEKLSVRKINRILKRAEAKRLGNYCRKNGHFLFKEVFHSWQ